MNEYMTILIHQFVIWKILLNNGSAKTFTSAYSYQHADSFVQTKTHLYIAAYIIHIWNIGIIIIDLTLYEL